MKKVQRGWELLRFIKKTSCIEFQEENVISTVLTEPHEPCQQILGTMEEQR